jgi:hypothetical protein
MSFEAQHDEENNDDDVRYGFNDNLVLFGLKGVEEELLKYKNTIMDDIKMQEHLNIISLLRSNYFIIKDKLKKRVEVHIQIKTLTNIYSKKQNPTNH